MKVLLTKIRALGDTVLLTSSVDYLRKTYPQMEITVMVPKAFAAVFENNPQVNAVWIYEERTVFEWLFRIRKTRFDLAFYLHASPRQKWWHRLGKAKRSFYHDQHKKTEKLYGRHPNALEWDAHLFQRVFQLVQRPQLPLPKIFLSEEEKQWGRNYWLQRGADPEKVIFLGLGASRNTKRWLPEHFARLAELVRDREEWIPAIIVGPGNAEAEFAGTVVDEMRAKGFRPTNRWEKSGHFLYEAGLSVRQLTAVLSAVHAYVGNDSGPKHLAVAVATKTYTFFGPEDPVEWHPYSRIEHPIFFESGLACRKEDHGRWCSLKVCVSEKHRCMRDLDPTNVFLEISADSPLQESDA